MPVQVELVVQPGKRVHVVLLCRLQLVVGVPLQLAPAPVLPPAPLPQLQPGCVVQAVMARPAQLTGVPAHDGVHLQPAYDVQFAIVVCALQKPLSGSQEPKLKVHPTMRSQSAEP